MAAINELLTTTEQEPQRRGAFIVLEGLDRSGKTTQVKLMEQRFVELGKPVKTVRFPGAFPPPPPFLFSWSFDFIS
jgi:hypothetical protein